MSREKRVELIEKIEEKLKSRVIVIVIGDRVNLQISLNLDILPILHQMFMTPSKYNDLTIFLYSRGGNTIAALSIVSLIRETFNSLRVIVPYRAHSAATLIALGADSIYMCKSGELSPVDVSITTAFNPLLDKNKPKVPGNILPVNVEDLNGYITFVKELLKIKRKSDLIKTLEILSKDLNPLAIGALHRAREQNKEIAITLMKYHSKDEKKIEKISEKLTRGLFTHSYLISRNDALNMELNIEDYEKEFEDLVMKLYFEYLNILELNVPYSAESHLKIGENLKRILLHRGLIEAVINEGDSNVLQSFSFQTQRKLKWIEVVDRALNAKISKILEIDINHCWNTNNEV